MTWNKKELRGKNTRYSLIKKLREENKSTEGFEIMLNSLT